jgi:hypothetical protein
MKRIKMTDREIRKLIVNALDVAEWFRLSRKMNIAQIEIEN